MEFLKTKLGIASNNNSSTSDKHEQFKSECIGRAYFTGLVVGPLTFSIVYFLQNNFTNQLKGQRKGLNLLTSSFFGIMAFYLTSNAKLTECEKNYKNRILEEQRKQKNPNVY